MEKSTGRLAAEGAAIIVSILIAFAVDAAWEYRGERAREHEAIGQLVVEFDEVATQLDSLHEDYTDGFGGEQSLRTLLQAMGSSRGDFPTVHLDSLIGATIANQRVRLPEGVLASLLASGDLALVRSDSLRAALAGWAPLKETVLDDIDSATSFNEEHLVPYLWPRVAVRAVDVATGYHEGLGPGPFEHDPWPLLRDRHFENLVNERLILMETNRTRLERARAHVDRVLELARRELER